MKILLVEDDEIKRQQVLDFLSDSFSDSEVMVARSYQSGLKAIVSSSPHLVVLDMSMRTFDTTSEEPGGRSQPYAGREILRQMSRRSIQIPVIVITQYDRFGEANEVLTLEELNMQLRRSFENIYLGTVYYNPTVDGWKEALERLISNAFKERVNL